MAKYSISTHKNLIKITKKSMKKIPVNERELAFFEENLLPGLFRPAMEGKHRMIYTAPQSVSLSCYIRKELNVHRFYSIVAQVVEMIKKIELYKFYLPNLVLDTKIIFVKETTGEMFFLYEPLLSRENNINVYNFLEKMVKEIKADDLELLKEIRAFLDFIADTANYRIEDIEQYILKRYPQIYQEIKRVESGKSGFIASSQLANRQHYEPSAQIGYAYENTAPVMEEEPETTVLSEEDGTTLLEDGTVLLSEKGITAGIIRVKTGEYFSISETVFSIGKSMENDLVLSDNKAISRKHAVIYKQNGNFVIVDQRSTNHSFLKGEMLEPDCEVELCDGDIIRLADEEFEFKLED